MFPSQKGAAVPQNSLLWFEILCNTLEGSRTGVCDLLAKGEWGHMTSMLEDNVFGVSRA